MFLATMKACSTLARVLESILFIPFHFLFREFPVSGGPFVGVVYRIGGLAVDLFRLAHVGRVPHTPLSHTHEGVR